MKKLWCGSFGVHFLFTSLSLSLEFVGMCFSCVNNNHNNYDHDEDKHEILSVISHDPPDDHSHLTDLSDLILISISSFCCLIHLMLMMIMIITNQNHRSVHPTVPGSTESSLIQPIVEYSTPVGMGRDPNMNVPLAWHMTTTKGSVSGRIWLRHVISSVSFMQHLTTSLLTQCQNTHFSFCSKNK